MLYKQIINYTIKKENAPRNQQNWEYKGIHKQSISQTILSEEINPKPKNPLITAPKKAKNTIKIVPKGFPPTNKKHIKTEGMKSTPIMLR